MVDCEQQCLALSYLYHPWWRACAAPFAFRMGHRAKQLSEILLEHACGPQCWQELGVFFFATQLQETLAVVYRALCIRYSCANFLLV